MCVTLAASTGSTPGVPHRLSRHRFDDVEAGAEFNRKRCSRWFSMRNLSISQALLSLQAG
jgi:hypothetical protein